MPESRILIVGGGVTGLAAACLLAKSGLQITLVEAGSARGWKPDQPPARVSALNLASQRILEAIGVWETIQEKRVSPYRHMRVWDSDSNARIHFDADSLVLPALGHIVENDLIVKTMQEKLAHNYNVSILYSSQITGIETSPSGISAQISTPEGTCTIEASLGIGADGANSALRQLAGINVRREEFDQDAVVATVKSTLPHENTAWQCFTPNGPVALLPLMNNQCSLVYSCDKSHLEMLLSDGAETLADALNTLFGDYLGEISVVTAPQSFSLHNQHAETYISNRIALVGDAAHTTHPLAGLGANIGLLDVAALCELIDKANATGKSFHSHSLLRRYERWRRGENGAVLVAMKTFKTVFGNTDPVLAGLRQSSFSIADRIKPLKNQLVSYAVGISGDLPEICR